MVSHGPVRERVIEEYLRTKSAGGGILCYKFVSPGNAGVPDRILVGRHLVTGETVVAFVEVKRPGGRTRPLQDVHIDRLRNRGANVDVVDTKPGVDKLLLDLFGVGAPGASAPTPAPKATGGGHVAGFAPSPRSPLR